MNKHKEPNEPPPEDSLAKLAQFTQRILRVPKSDVQDKGISDGPKKIDEPCPE
jgi:hypothetical protein